jgi:hypothetical protein
MMMTNNKRLQRSNSLYNDGYELAESTRTKVARAVIDCMLLRASRLVNEAENRNGRVAIIPADTFRMNLMALVAALDGETRAEYLAVDDEGAATIAKILHEDEGQVVITAHTVLIEQAHQLYSAAALAGKDVEANNVDPLRFEVHWSQYRAVAAAAMMLGEILARVSRAESGGRDAR